MAYCRHGLQIEETILSIFEFFSMNLKPLDAKLR